MKSFKTINYGAYNILVAIVNDEIYFKTEDIKKIFNLDTYKEQMSNKTKFCSINPALELAKSSSTILSAELLNLIETTPKLLN